MSENKNKKWLYLIDDATLEAMGISIKEFKKRFEPFKETQDFINLQKKIILYGILNKDAIEFLKNIQKG